MLYAASSHRHSPGGVAGHRGLAQQRYTTAYAMHLAVPATLSRRCATDSVFKLSGDCLHGAALCNAILVLVQARTSMHTVGPAVSLELVLLCCCGR